MEKFAPSKSNEKKASTMGKINRPLPVSTCEYFPEMLRGIMTQGKKVTGATYVDHTRYVRTAAVFLSGFVTCCACCARTCQMCWVFLQGVGKRPSRCDTKVGSQQSSN